MRKDTRDHSILPSKPRFSALTGTSKATSDDSELRVTTTAENAATSISPMDNCHYKMEKVLMEVSFDLVPYSNACTETCTKDDPTLGNRADWNNQQCFNNNHGGKFHHSHVPAST